jgi:hypothetical protein
MSDQAEPVYADDGTFLGTQVPIEDGGWALVDEAGEVIAACDEDLNELDPDDFAFEDPSLSPEDEQLLEAHQRLDELEARLDQPLPEPVVELPDAWDERAVAAMNRQREHIAHALGRPTTQGEDARLAEYALRDAEAGGELPDLLQANSRLQAEGRPGLYDLDAEGRAGHEQRTAYATERLRQEAGEIDHTGQEARRDEIYDMDSHQGRVDAAVDALQGHETDGLTYNSSDYQEGP